ncbi:MAG: hypothetical protein ACREPR_08105 [Brasilonema sp.]
MTSPSWGADILQHCQLAQETPGGWVVVMIPDVNRPSSASTLFWVGSTGVFAMGVQNALMRVTLGWVRSNTVGELQQFSGK